MRSRGTLQEQLWLAFYSYPGGVMNLSLRMVTMIIVYALYEIENSNIEMRRGMLFSHYSDVAL